MTSLQSQFEGVPLTARTLDADDRVEGLLSRCALRDQRALTELYELVSSQLFGVLLRILKRRALNGQL